MNIEEDLERILDDESLSGNSDFDISDDEDNVELLLENAKLLHLEDLQQSARDVDCLLDDGNG